MVKRMRQRITPSEILCVWKIYPRISPSISRSENYLHNRTQKALDSHCRRSFKANVLKRVSLKPEDYQVLTLAKFIPTTRQIKVDIHLTRIGDALLEIFFYLDADELWNCEKVCVDWKNVISCETLWKRIFLQKVKKCSN
jgi:hypothetical protein